MSKISTNGRIEKLVGLLAHLLEPLSVDLSSLVWDLDHSEVLGDLQYGRDDEEIVSGFPAARPADGQVAAA
jgi:hypothetical protein